MKRNRGTWETTYVAVIIAKRKIRFRSKKTFVLVASCCYLAGLDARALFDFISRVRSTTNPWENWEGDASWTFLGTKVGKIFFSGEWTRPTNSPPLVSPLIFAAISRAFLQFKDAPRYDRSRDGSSRPGDEEGSREILLRAIARETTLKVEDVRWIWDFFPPPFFFFFLRCEKFDSYYLVKYK